HTRYSTDEPRWRCDCGGMLDLDFEPVFDLPRIQSRPANLWRYLEALPLSNTAPISLGESMTALLPVEFDGKTALIKQDHLFPSGSFKDRGASVMMSKIHSLGIRSVVEDSSGNAGSAVAAYSAAAGIDCEIYVPASTSPGKLAQIRMYGARLNQVPGSRQDTSEAIWQAAQKTFYASHIWNPYFLHGTKTFAFEVCEQLGWQAPDTVVVPAAHGSLLLGTYIGFSDLLKAGVTRKMPKLIAVQAANCAPLAAAFHAGADEPAVVDARPTLAEGISISVPLRGKQMLEAVRSTGGTFMAVEEDEILQTLRRMAARGLYIEPTTAAIIAGVIRYLPSSQTGEVVVSAFTGHGLKATEKLLKLTEHAS
ncbi:MAG: threonine synthase, partial [Anaerolineaceae bacterium]